MARLQAGTRRSPRFIQVTAVWFIGLALLVLAMTRSQEQAWLSSQPVSRRASPSRTSRAAAEGSDVQEAPAKTAEGAANQAAPKKPKKEISNAMRARLIEEASAMGDEDKPITTGFGNPYLLVIVVVLVLGGASYYQLGLDKVLSPNAAAPAEKDVLDAYMKTQRSMYGTQF
eukprot:gb/GFBE01048262.1/.p1 GENE.gb/GFBE01048262.1/~~gb/GFBE01048262.1/.p1  ORF type:complete len:172 (+),score=42.94 gb/GFBE01048262.1/:1-516(+)